jgi:uncharacterized protein
MAEGLLAIGKVLLSVAIGVPLALYFLQDRLIFYPQPYPEQRRADLEKRFPAARSVSLAGADGKRIHAWHIPGSQGAPLVIYFGGNAEEVSWMIGEATSRVPGTGWLLVDYRGYGASEGSPSEAAIKADALAWYDLAKKTIQPARVSAFGRSLGSGAAVFLASERQVDSVILVTPFDSLVEVAGHYYPWLPVSWMLRHRFDSLELAPKLTIPLLCLVATKDEVVPVKHAKRLYDAWGGAKTWVALDGAGHNTTDSHPFFWQHVTDFLVKKPS